MTRPTAPMTARGWHAVEEFVAADHVHLDATVRRVRDAVARNIREVLGDHPAQEALVRAEAGRARRHKALRGSCRRPRPRSLRSSRAGP